MKTKLLYWAPRIICILACLFIGMFAFDSFEGDSSFLHKLVSFLMNLFPFYIMAALTLIAWRWEQVGGILLLIVGIMGGAYVFSINYGRNHSYWISLGIYCAIALPFIIAGVLFLLNYRHTRKNLTA